MFSLLVSISGDLFGLSVGARRLEQGIFQQGNRFSKICIQLPRHIMFQQMTTAVVTSLIFLFRNLISEYSQNFPRAGFGRSSGFRFFPIRHFGVIVGIPSPNEGEELLIDSIVPDSSERIFVDSLRRRIFVRVAGANRRAALRLRRRRIVFLLPPSAQVVGFPFRSFVHKEGLEVQVGSR